ncbi:MAG: 5-methyltetrahydropteroyltriglutamate--homocysteine S-methyltransferase [Betaproteobacteria bacterium]|nr:5-methyltetrahydropteroyltriglutamate--homocysteine S-methyltransferase [Betaproteobacteria bacterium]
MKAAARPPFRADQVGSLIRPERLLRARDAHASGSLSIAALRTVEDECIREVVRLQEEIGLNAVTDGEFRRFMFHIDVLEKLGGIEKRFGEFKHRFKGGQSGDDEFRPMVFHIVDRLRHLRDITVDDYTFLGASTTRTGKVTLPAPTFVYGRAGLNAISPAIYPDRELFFHDLAAVYHAELAALARAGCRYVQLDETNLPILCDPELAAAVRLRGDDPAELARLHIRTINEAIADRPADLTVVVHFCRGNYRGGWVAEGGYEPVAERVFSTLNVDGFMLEYDDARSGDFKPLRFIPRGKSAILGLVSSKHTDLEDADSLKRRLDEAAKFLPLDQLGISPQCGFSSGVGSNVMTMDEQWAKLRLVTRVAREVWGTTARS